MTDPFQQDAQRRQALMDRVLDVRLALYEAHEKQDAQAALKALGDAYRLLDLIEGAQLLHVGDEPVSSTAFAVPSTYVQMVARYGGPCIVCDDRIRIGDVMYWDRVDRCMICARCSVQELTGARK